MKHYTREYPGWIRYKIKEPKAIKTYTSKAYGIYTEYLDLKCLGILLSERMATHMRWQSQRQGFMRRFLARTDDQSEPVVDRNYEEYRSLGNYLCKRNYKLTAAQQKEYDDLKRQQIERKEDILGFGNNLHSAVARSLK